MDINKPSIQRPLHSHIRQTALFIGDNEIEYGNKEFLVNPRVVGCCWLTRKGITRRIETNESGYHQQRFKKILTDGLIELKNMRNEIETIARRFLPLPDSIGSCQQNYIRITRVCRKHEEKITLIRQYENLHKNVF